MHYPIYCLLRPKICPLTVAVIATKAPYAPGAINVELNLSIINPRATPMRATIIVM